MEGGGGVVERGGWIDLAFFFTYLLFIYSIEPHSIFNVDSYVG